MPGPTWAQSFIKKRKRDENTFSTHTMPLVFYVC